MSDLVSLCICLGLKIYVWQIIIELFKSYFGACFYLSCTDELILLKHFIGLSETFLSFFGRCSLILFLLCLSKLMTLKSDFSVFSLFKFKLGSCVAGLKGLCLIDYSIILLLPQDDINLIDRLNRE